MYGFVQDVLADKGGQVFTATSRMNVRDAVRSMNEHGVGALLVAAARNAVTTRSLMMRPDHDGPSKMASVVVMGGAASTVSLRGWRVR